MRVYVNVEDKRWKKYKIDFKKIVAATVGSAYEDAEVSITLVNDKDIRKINREYRSIDKPTNVLSFELGDDILLGDIFISFDTVYDEAMRDGKSVPEHTAHMVVHGMLHLLGYDHILDKDAKKMEKREVIVLKKLGYKNPYTAKRGVCNKRGCCIGDKTIGRLKRFFAGGFGCATLYALCAIVAVFGFAPFNLWWTTLLGIGCAYVLSVKRLQHLSWWKRFWRIAPFGAFYAVGMFWWVLHSIYVVPELQSQFAIWTAPALIGIALVGVLIFVWPFVAISSIRRNMAYRPFVFASLWMFILWMREWFLTGFPWNPIANISLVNVYVSNAMSLYGALGLSFVITGIIATVAEITINRHKISNWITLFFFLVVGAFGVGYGIKNINESGRGCATTRPIIRIVQPAQTAVQKGTFSRAAAIQHANSNLMMLAGLAQEEGEYDLVVFPETSYPFVVVDGDNIELAKILGRPTIIGSNYYAAGKIYNSLLTVMPNGAVSGVYSKSHLVPFGEYRPFGNIIPTPGQLTPGDGPELISINLNGTNFVFAPAVCYEIIFSDSLMPDSRTPDAIINLTNDNWFGKTPGTYQHLDMVRRYAIESGVPIIRSNYSGISAFVSADGSVAGEIPIGMAGHLDGTVCGAHKTLYRVFGRDLWLIIMLGLASICAVAIARKFPK